MVAAAVATAAMADVVVAGVGAAAAAAVAGGAGAGVGAAAAGAGAGAVAVAGAAMGTPWTLSVYRRAASKRKKRCRLLTASVFTVVHHGGQWVFILFFCASTGKPLFVTTSTKSTSLDISRFPSGAMTARRSCKSASESICCCEAIAVAAVAAVILMAEEET